MRIGFFGTPELARRVLSDLFSASSVEISFVVTNPDKPVGRDQLLRSSPVKAFALEKNIPIYTPLRIRGNEQLLDDIRSYNCDYFIVIAYGKILPLELLDLPKRMCINIHGSILPKYRGASPIQAALLSGETKTGVTIMQMSEGMDEGNILKIREIDIDPSETSGSLFEKFAQISGLTLIDTLRELEHGGITPLPQDHTLATYCKKIEKEDGFVDWSKSAREIYHMWQAYTPWPGIYTMYEGKRLLLEKVSLPCHSEGNEESMTQKSGSFAEAQDDGNIGQVLKRENGTLGVVCGEGILTLEQVKLEGKRSQSIGDFSNGHRQFLWSILF